jgi:hypothetical protein
MNRVMTAGLDQRRRLTVESRRAAGRPRARRLPWHRRSRSRRRARAGSSRGSISRAHVERARKSGRSPGWRCCPAVRGGNVRPRRWGSASGTSPIPSPGCELRQCFATAAGRRSSRSRNPAAHAPFFAVVRPDRLCSASAPGGRPTYLPASVRRFPTRRRSPSRPNDAGSSRSPSAFGGTSPTGGPEMSAGTALGRLALTTYLEVKRGAAPAAVAPSRDRGSSRRDALAAGGKRLRPVLTFLRARGHGTAGDRGRGDRAVHMATLVHDDIVDGARRRGRAAA